MAQTLENIIGEKLIEAVGKSDGEGVKSILREVAGSSLSMVKVLGTENADGNSSLHVAARLTGDNFAIAKTLLLYGADVNQKNYLAETPLHVAAGVNNIQTAELFIKTGANVHLEDASGKTPLDIAKENSFAQEAALIVRHGGERTPAELAAKARPAAAAPKA